MENKELKLLPNYFKKIGVAIFALTILLIIIFLNDIISVNRELGKSIITNIILIGLLIIALSKEKTEDERTTKLRLIAFASSFIFGVAFVIVMPFVNVLFDGNFLSDVSTAQLILTMFLWYFAIFSSGKKFN